MGKDNRANRYSPDTRARAVRMVLDNQGSYESQAAAIKAIAPKIGCGDGFSMRKPTRVAGMARRRRSGPRLRSSNARCESFGKPTRFLKKASAYFAQAALDRPLKR